jgi:glutamate racemase
MWLDGSVQVLGTDFLPVMAAPSLVPVPGAVPAPLFGSPVMSRALISPTILVFDSGVGGLTVFREIAQARPDAHFVYVADDAFFPYGGKDEAQLVERIVTLMGELILTHAPDLIVIACNTASVQALPALRQAYDLPFVGTVPAIKPACAASLTRQVSVLGTLATVKREYTHGLIRQFGGDCAVTLVGSGTLAGYAERQLAGSPVDDDALAAEIAPCFVERDGMRTDTVVLACTHYPLLAARMERLAPWPVRWLDPAPAIARRVLDLVGAPSSADRHPPALVFTSGKPPKAGLRRALPRFGFVAAAPRKAAPAFDTQPVSP